MNRSILSILISCCFAFSHLSAQPVLLFDSQTLIRVDQKKLEQYVSGLSGLIDFFLHPSFSPIEEAQKRFWEKLESKWGKQAGPEAAMVRDQDGQRILPWLMVQWFKGDITGQQATTLVKAQCPAFVSSIADVAFSAELLARHSYVTQEALTFVEKCSHLTKLFMVGNWHLEVFSLVAVHQQPLLNYIPAQNRYISGIMRLVLPCDIAPICELIAKDAQISVKDIIFVTSIPYHSLAAQQKGIKTILITNNNYQVAYEAIAKALGSA